MITETFCTFWSVWQLKFVNKVIRAYEGLKILMINTIFPILGLLEFPSYGKSDGNDMNLDSNKENKFPYDSKTFSTKPNYLKVIITQN